MQTVQLVIFLSIFNVTCMSLNIRWDEALDTPLISFIHGASL
jgi:hypothetical protein